MAGPSFIIGIIGNVISILVFASLIKTFTRVVKKKSTENFKGSPYITTLLCTSLWTFYGILNPDGLLITTVNGAGALLQLSYVILYLMYAPKEKKIKSMKLAALLNIGFLGSVIAVTLLALHGNLRLTFVGILCACLTIGMYASPLAVMRIVIKTESVKYMPFLLSFFLFLNASIWGTYSLLVKDLYIGVPQVIGFVLGTAQLILYAMYKNKSPSEESDEDLQKEEERSAHLVKEVIEMKGRKEDGDDQITSKNRALRKGSSLPKPPVIRQSSIGKVLRTLSMGPYEQQHWVWFQDEENDHNRDLEGGKKSGSQI
ncbi:bidirectional sugar transporter SWEET16-like [Punica granatum]|uniref:Bidirectional sugar transporter SWEET16-like n=2 Tax=Punica granatum TaxID=22663 RepID=A0A6P8C807_PUNGR|nr:bidirectional sugar transporter SWEET16-like [Punica granatum]PKI49770.1 hypothetical protein CRG98_029819 [Punica granatum]